MRPPKLAGCGRALCKCILRSAYYRSAHIMRGIWCRTEVPSMVTNYEIHIYIKKGIPQNLLLRNALDYRLQDVYSVEVYTQNSILLKWNWRLKKFTVPKYTLKSAHSAQSAFYKFQHSELPPWKRTSPQEALKSTLLSLQWQFGHFIVLWISQMCVSKEHKTSSPHKVCHYEQNQRARNRKYNKEKFVCLQSSH